jgi:hypothetical protein
MTNDPILRQALPEQAIGVVDDEGIARTASTERLDIHIRLTVLKEKRQ